MSGPENTFIASVHRHLPSEAELYRLKNNNVYHAGIADCWYSAARDLWIEWKFVVVPKRDDTVIDLHSGKKPSMSALQREWLSRRHEEGRNVWVGIGSKDGGVILTTPADWQGTWKAAEFRDRTLDRKSIARMISNFVQGH